MRELTQTMTLTEALLDPILSRDPAAPRITYYDDATGARIELSGATLANWAAKTANLIRDEFGLTAGARVAVLLPAHWQTAAVLFGCWWAGVEVVLRPDPDAELALVAADRIDEADGIPEVAALSLDPMGAPVRDLPIGVTDFATSVRVHGDQFLPRGVGAALDGMPVADVVAAARKAALRQGIGEGDRVLSSLPWETAAELIDGLLATLAAGAGLVQVVNPDPAQRPRRVETERITVQLA
ncbi:TIGR03089 family protein [Nocardia farcinica]|uniref:TIGR03089 family protein n=1 Tax=Nocardia farcinica TaxID=37329 RepID=UPI001895B1E1|nr:TIGR03089 family protein [Nocardia farcinica]MBF6254556.1 TIGR03089 family protein [Nocardia farcinica]MBF6265898.1 TIGR03089 family protein [Nocardia farcinica]MBF6284391.1 TIGR03089 family protein [Nocardia farcinica]MBF6308909.1 TIGR03089 family protein [Nocardia farcinica]MBF6393930.1 TIGR03089 family protein [Nocardia farcinica]